MIRGALLPLAAAVLVGGVVGVNAANGGGDYAPVRTADPCVARTVTSVSPGIEGLTERLVLLGLDGAACRLHKSREALTLELAQPGARSEATVRAVRAGLLDAVDRLAAAGTLPKASSLVDEALDDSDLNGFVKALIRALPDSLIDKNLKTDDVLRRAIRKLDLRQLLGNLDDPDAVQRSVSAAVKDAVKDALVQRLRDLI